MLKRLVASAHYRLNVKPMRILPPPSEVYLHERAARDKKIKVEAADFVRSLNIKTDVDFTGAGGTDYLLLHRYVIERRPDRVLELGSGVTTYVLARAMQEVGHGELVTVDHITKYSEGAEALLSPELRKRVTFMVSPSVGERYKGVDANRYLDTPAGHFDMIFVDGPTNGFGDTEFPISTPMHCLGERPTDIFTDRKIVCLTHYSLWLDVPVRFDPVFGVGFMRASAGDLRTAPELRPAVAAGEVFDAMRGST